MSGKIMIAQLGPNGSVWSLPKASEPVCGVTPVR
jgi:hypothetical protein